MPTDLTDAEPLERIAANFERLEAERDKLQRFKTWVHAYLDAKGIPADPGGPHSAEGCRIGDRMDFVFERLRLVNECLVNLEQENERQERLLERCRDTIGIEKSDDEPTDYTLLRDIDKALEERRS